MRAPLELAVDAWTLLAPMNRITGLTLNLSGGGALLRLTELPAAATILELRLALPGGWLSAPAEIVRRNDDGTIAVTFDRIDPTQQDRLIEFVFKRLRELTPTRLVSSALSEP